MKDLTLEKFFFETPLYETIECSNWDGLVDLLCFDGVIDGPCPFCDKDTTYIRNGVAPARFQLSGVIHNYRTFSISICCSRDKSHIVEIFIRTLDDYNISKIGQFPSLASVTKGEINKYRKVLGPRFYEFNRGIGLVSHGIGIGSFVYLRRVFEDLIDQAHKQAILGINWNEDAYVRSRMDEKIEKLKGLLPIFLVKNKALYGILSKGIHELTEQECLDIFPVVKLGIELILDEKLAQREKELKIKHAEELIANAATKLKP